MRNRFPGSCYRCHDNVEVGAGHFEKFRHGWRLQHAECAVAYRGSGMSARMPRPASMAEAQRIFVSMSMVRERV